jgi:hypothetical protein
MGDLSDLICLDRFLHSATGEEPVNFSRNDDLSSIFFGGIILQVSSFRTECSVVENHEVLSEAKSNLIDFSISLPVKNRLASVEMTKLPGMMDHLVIGQQKSAVSSFQDWRFTC